MSGPVFRKGGDDPEDYERDQVVRRTEFRLRKASLIHAYVGPKVTSDELATWNQVQRDAVAQLTGVQVPSVETWAAVVELRAARERALARFPQPDDPFDGL